MKTICSNCPTTGRHNRPAVCLLVPINGTLHRFTGESIPGVCHAVEIARDEGSVSTWKITHKETTAVVSLFGDLATGRMFPQTSWEAGYLWLAQQAPMLTTNAFQAFIRDTETGTAKRWDAAKAADAEFGAPATPEELALIQAAQERVAAAINQFNGANHDPINP